MKELIQKITPAILDSHKIKVKLKDGKDIIVNPHIVVRRKHGEEILKSTLDNGGLPGYPGEGDQTFFHFARRFRY